jgi:hypothetical protein
VLEGVGRLPTKYQWVFTIPVSSLELSPAGTQGNDPDDFVEWLKEISTKAREVTFFGPYKSMNGVKVLVSPPQILREKINPKDGAWDGTVQIAVRTS